MIEEYETFKFVKEWPLLESIDLSGQDNITNVKWLKWVPKIKIFIASGCVNIRNFERLAGLIYLIKLDLSYCAIENIDFINAMNLEYLDLEGSDDIAPDGFDLLAQFTNLKYLNLSGTKFNDVLHLASLEKLEELDLGDLEYNINIMDYNNLDVEDLKLLKNLKKLNLQEIELNAHPLFLEELPNLEYLSLNLCKGNKIKLPSMPKLKSLNLSFGKLTDVEFEKPLNSLFKIKLLHCEFKNLDFLEFMPNVEEVDSNNNVNLESVGPCLNLKKLQRLNLRGCINVKTPATSDWRCEDLRELNLKKCTWMLDLDFLRKLPNLYSINLEDIELAFASDIYMRRFPKLKLIKVD